LPPQLEQVAETLCHHEGDGSAPLLEDDVGGQRGAVHHPADLIRSEPGGLEHLFDTGGHTDSRILGRGDDLVGHQAAVGAGYDDVGERAAHVDTHEVFDVGHSPYPYWRGAASALPRRSRTSWALRSPSRS